ncbi:hypothetical protein [Haloferax sp. KTX1]|uniref:hypothetical protein n=1 Tax=Haloferax sp. KTX1 TaxID=2600597 RepID=UPI0011DC9628|nr:hypothetical protein [Haloferax sp. KTX1]
MPKENRFAGLGEAMESESEPDDEEASDRAAPDESESKRSEPTVEAGPEIESEPETESDSGDAGGDPDSEGEPDSESVDSDERSEGGEPQGLTGSNAEADGAEHVDDAEQATKSEGGPAFEFESTTAKSIYVRTETLDRLDDAEFEVESHLRREHDVRDLTGREFHDALVRVAAEYPEEIADAVLETRDE